VSQVGGVLGAGCPAITRGAGDMRPGSEVLGEIKGIQNPNADPFMGRSIAYMQSM
jgi:hypothetical protein